MFFIAISYPLTIAISYLIFCPVFGGNYTPYLAYPKVHPDHHITFRKSLYSLPTKYIGKKVEVRGDSALVRIYFNDVLIKTHKKVQEGKRSTDFTDYPKEITPYTLRNPQYQIDQGRKMHPIIGDYIRFMLSGSYPWHRIRSIQRLLVYVNIKVYHCIN